jgi:hypothetical protein
MNQTDQVVAEHLQQGFVALGDGRLAAEGVAELPLHGRKGPFDVRPTVIPRQKLVLLELESSETAGSTSPTCLRPR